MPFTNIIEVYYALDLNTYEHKDFEQKIIKISSNKDFEKKLYGLLKKSGIEQEDLDSSVQLMMKEYTKQFVLKDVSEWLSDLEYKEIKSRNHKRCFFSVGSCVREGFFSINLPYIEIFSERQTYDIKNVKQLWISVEV